ncbi:hypothetical protein EV644_1413 [Kribbella orskensis]|uniref:HEAT repeat protein n=1 Tax=Kribbella orskensis TaxID=2512216 RepID=A0ABY2B6V1_9ACTN|nr:hypothetical protein EV642_14433 [Kribbella sp. VKM Ac-2500]TCO09057.1 hypothetical protein EV644_1413 [Kribbella orskensis]
MQPVPSNSHSWLFNLTDPDPARRRAALDRQAELIATWSAGLRWSNTLWYQNGRSSDFSHSPRLTAEYDQAEAMQRNAIAQTLYSVAGGFSRARYQELDDSASESVPYAVLFLQWEVGFQHEWRTAAPWSPWELKERILRGFIKAGPLGWDEALLDLVMAAVNREHWCEDRWYAALARRLDSPELRNLLAEAAASTDPLVRLRAGYVSAVLDDRSTAVTVASWRRWLAATDG